MTYLFLLPPPTLYGTRLSFVGDFIMCVLMNKISQTLHAASNKILREESFGL